MISAGSIAAARRALLDVKTPCEIKDHARKLLCETYPMADMAELEGISEQDRMNKIVERLHALLQIAVTHLAAFVGGIVICAYFGKLL